MLLGEMYFKCPVCDYNVCKSCGPGVFIERSYDFFDSETGELNEEELPAHVLHERTARRRSLKHKSRGVVLESEVLDLAHHVLDEAEALIGTIDDEEEAVFDKNWDASDLLCRWLRADDMLAAANNMSLIVTAVTSILASQPLLSEATVPCKVFGDIHGQLRDLLLLWRSFGIPGSEECPAAVFNGDFVDRGKHQVEVLCLLFALKLAHPDKIWLNRGNHEDHHMNQRYGFQKACTDAFGPDYGPVLYSQISNAFNHLPLACLIGGKVLAVHGGIGDGQWQLSDLRHVPRPVTHSILQDPRFAWLWNILWSDPIEDDQAGANVFGVHPSPRSKLAVKFGWNVTQAFCAHNGLDLVVRSHQAKKCGLGFDVMHNESLMRVFSARDYENNHNDGAVLHISAGEDEEGPPRLIVRSQVLGSLWKDR